MPLAPRTMLAFIPEALAASQIGTWEADFEHDRVVGDETTAALFGFETMVAAHGVPLARWAEAIHPADRMMFYDKLNPARECGGLFVVEYRTCPSPGEVRWVLARGRFEYDETLGGMRGRGICVDITESKMDGHVEDRAFFMGRPEAETPLEHVADLAIATRRAIDEVEGEDGRTLRRAVDVLLWTVGRVLAHRSAEGANRRH
jgi:hypothetical protein